MRDFEVGEKLRLVINQRIVVAEVVSINAGTYTVVTPKGINYRANTHEVMPFDINEIGAAAITAKVDFIKDEERKLERLTNMFENIKNKEASFYLKVSHNNNRRDDSYYFTKTDMEAIRLGYELAVDAQVEKLLELKAELERGDYSVDETD
ncbi:hypothetical protein HB904_04405 [Listeria booriae]|uniref:Uncharacterized protein n=1 Tax=Listeria booriae TaxID=1552123 RepID=A0A842AGM0_9LIST|nr:hypothetical protein [Listeria booriae]MBC1615415.1 hypothetical protein [Listeria booriae]